MSAKQSEYEKRRARRYSTGSTVSRYLGPLPGSCHDFCKYGNKEEARLDIRSVISRGRMTMKLSGGRGSEGEIPLMGIIKDEHTDNKMNLAAELRKKAALSRLPKSKMQSLPASSPCALKPKSIRTPWIVPSKSCALPAKVKSIVIVGMWKSIGPLTDSTAPTKAQKENKAEQSGGDNKEGFQGEELHSNDGKVEEEASESTNYQSMPSFSDSQENRSSCKFSDFTELEELDATEVEDEAEKNQSAEDACRAKKLNFKREKVNGLQSLIHCPRRRLKFRNHSDDDKCEDSGYLSDPGSMKVALRHWQMQEKKAAPRLLNDVIKKTAVELGRTQKSKVKALVGAFETVISLQDVDSSASIGK